MTIRVKGNDDDDVVVVVLVLEVDDPTFRLRRLRRRGAISSPVVAALSPLVEKGLDWMVPRGKASHPGSGW